jgi:hypothetical protein
MLLLVVVVWMVWIQHIVAEHSFGTIPQMANDITHIGSYTLHTTRFLSSFFGFYFHGGKDIESFTTAMFCFMRSRRMKDLFLILDLFFASPKIIQGASIHSTIFHRGSQQRKQIMTTTKTTSSSTSLSAGVNGLQIRAEEKCASPKCDNLVEHKLACPKCMQLGLPPTYFCSQTCFKENYNEHKKVHAIAKQLHIAQQQQQQVPTRCVVAAMDDPNNNKRSGL